PSQSSIPPSEAMSGSRWLPDWTLTSGSPTASAAEGSPVNDGQLEPMLELGHKAPVIGGVLLPGIASLTPCLSQTEVSSSNDPRRRGGFARAAISLIAATNQTPRAAAIELTAAAGRQSPTTCRKF